MKIRAAIPYIYTAEKNLRSHLGLLTRYFFFILPCIFKVCQIRKKGEKGREVNVAFCVVWQNLRPYFKYCYIKAEILKLLSDRLPYFHFFWLQPSFKRNLFLFPVDAIYISLLLAIFCANLSNYDNSGLTEMKPQLLQK